MCYSQLFTTLLCLKRILSCRAVEQASRDWYFLGWRQNLNNKTILYTYTFVYLLRLIKYVFFFFILFLILNRVCVCVCVGELFITNGLYDSSRTRRESTGSAFVVLTVRAYDLGEIFRPGAPMTERNNNYTSNVNAGYVFMRRVHIQASLIGGPRHK